MRDIHKHLWKLPILEFDASDSDHVAVSEAGRDAAAGVERGLVNLRQRYPKLTVTIARREIRKWLWESAEGGGVVGDRGEIESCILDLKSDARSNWCCDHSTKI